MDQLVDLDSLFKAFCDEAKSSIKTDAAIDKRILDDALIAYERSAWKTRKRSAVRWARYLAQLGISWDYLAQALHCSRSYVAKIFNAHERTAPPYKILQQIDNLVRQKMRCMTQLSYEMGLLKVKIRETCNAACANVSDVSKPLLEQSVVNGLASLMAGLPEPVDLPEGIDGVVAQIEDEPHLKLIIAIRTADPRSDKLALAHEYDDLSNYFRNKADDLRSSSGVPLDRQKQPKVAF